MRKKITLLTLSVFALISIFAQTQNISFETWQQKSFTFDPSIIDPALGAFLPAETYSYSVPQNWSSINQISKYSLLGGNELARKDSSAANVVDGSYAIKLTTTQITLPIINQNIVLPAFVVSGDFDIDPSIFAGAVGGGGGGGIDITSFAGAGQPINFRPESLVGNYNYIPNGNDSAWVISALVKTLPNGDRELVALAETRQVGSTGGMVAFSIDYEYTSCATPDTVITFFSSSYIDANTQFLGNNGSILYVDSVGVDGIATPPFLNNDNATIFVNETATIDILANDVFCDGDDDVPAITVAPNNGIATVNANDEIVYTPNTDFTGTDVLTYEICGPEGCSQATVTITVNPYPECVATVISRIVTGNVTDVFNASTVDCDNSTLTISVAASNGTAAVVGGQLSYTPNTDYLGSDQFTYRVCSPFISTQCSEADVFITVLTSINQLNRSIISVFPNPAKDVLFVTLNSNDLVNLKLIDMTGKLVIENNFTNETSVNIGNTPNGIYILKLETKEGVATQKIQIVQ